MQVQNLGNTNGICYADFSVGLCKVVASYYLMKAVTVNSNDGNLIDLERRANESFEYWVSHMLILHPR